MFPGAGGVLVSPDHGGVHRHDPLALPARVVLDDHLVQDLVPRTVRGPLPPGGELLCDFLPRESAALALGADGFEESSGSLARDAAGRLSGAGCSVTLDGQDD